MRTLLLAAGLVLVTVAAAPARYDVATRDSTFQEATIAPQTVPAAVPSTDEFTPAPVPSQDAAPPAERRAAGPEQPELTPELFQPHKSFRGDGYTDGSTIQGNEDRHLRPAPGFSLKMPLE